MKFVLPQQNESGSTPLNPIVLAVFGVSLFTLNKYLGKKLLAVASKEKELEEKLESIERRLELNEQLKHSTDAIEEIGKSTTELSRTMQKKVNK